MSKTLLYIGNFLSKSVITKALCEDLCQKFEEQGFNILRASNKKNSILKVIDMLFVILKNRRKYSRAIIDLYSNYAFYWGFLSGKLLYFLKKPFYLILRGGDLPAFSKKRRKLVKNLFSSAKKVIAPSDYLKENMKEYRKDIIVIPNYINLEKYFFRPRGEIKLKLIWIRAFHKVYSPILVLKSFEKIKKFYPNSNLCLIGPDKKDGTYEDVINFINEKSLKDSVNVIKGVKKEEIPEYLNLYDIFINTSKIDNFPVTVLEAMASGLCVISTKVGGIPYLIKDGENGLLVNPENYEEIFNSIENLYKNPDLCKKLSINAKDTATKYSWDEIYPLWENLFNSNV